MMNLATSRIIVFLIVGVVLITGFGINSAKADEHSPKIASIIQKAMEKCSATDTMASTLSASDLSILSDDIVHVTEDGQIEITVHSKTQTGESEELDLLALGARIVTVLILPPELNLQDVGMIQAWVPYDKIDEVADLSWVVAITAPGYGDVDTHPTNPINSEGVVFHNADIAQAQGITGAGVTIGAISDGVTSLAIAQARNELPAVTVLNAGSNDEGTAMLEIIHDMAPGAALQFSGTGGGVVNHVLAQVNLVAAGSDVIVEDIAFDAQPAFQQGLAAASGDAIAGAGVSVHSSAGNRGNNHSARVSAVGTGSGPDGFNGIFSGCTINPTNVVAIAPGGDTTFDVVLGSNNAGTSGSSFTLQWSEPRAIFPTAGAGGFTDLDLYIMDATGTTCLAESIGFQGSGTGDTIEQVSSNPALAGTNAKIVVNLFGNASAAGAPLLDLRWRRTQAGGDVTTRAGSLNPDSNYIGLATSSAALFQGNGGIEASSSGGPVQLGLTTVCPGGIYPCANGVAGPGITTTQIRPTWAATDGVSVSGSGGFGAGTCPAPNPGGQGACQFFGTSAAAPHAAACEALVREAIPGSTVASATGQMTSTAIDINPAGPDNTTGAGQLDCYTAVSPPVALCQNQTVNTDPGVCQTDNVSVDNGSFDPLGDSITLAQNPDNPYPLGGTSVNLTVTDSVGLNDSCTATVTVEDHEDPTITAPTDVTVECSGQNGQAIDIGDAVAADNCSVVVTNDAPLLYFLGTTTVNWTATDGSANTADDTQDVTVEDTTPPEVFCNAPATIVPPDAPVSYTATATDICDATVDFSITGFRCFEIKKNGRVVDKAESCIVSFENDTIYIEDSGGVNDHIEWTVFAEDDSGNTTTETCEVLVVRK